MFKKILITSLIMFVCACPLHFTYDFFNNLTIVGFFVPINESIFEHTKLIFIPLMLFYSLYYFFKKYKIDSDRYFFTLLLTILLGILLVPMLYYFYTESFGIELFIVDIFITLIALGLANLFFYNYYNLHNFTFKKETSLFFLLLIFIFYIYTSINLINLPIFIPK